VRSGYLRLAQSEPKRFLVIDGTQGVDAIARIIWEWVKGRLPVKEAQV
jgi:thymidylate kinase